MGELQNIVVVPYNSGWPQRFQCEAQRITAIFGQELLSIHHIGSTSIPGMKAKPIIDILAVVRHIEAVERFNPAMIQLGYEPEGEFRLDGKHVEPDKDLAQTLKAGLLCNNAVLEKEEDGYRILGDPTEGALLVSAAKAGITGMTAKLDEIPFESESQYMATLHRGDLSVGGHQAVWNGLNSYGSPVSSGAYWYVLKTASGDVSGRMLVTD